MLAGIANQQGQIIQAARAVVLMKHVFDENKSNAPGEIAMYQTTEHELIRLLGNATQSRHDRGNIHQLAVDLIFMIEGYIPIYA